MIKSCGKVFTAVEEVFEITQSWGDWQLKEASENSQKVVGKSDCPLAQKNFLPKTLQYSSLQQQKILSSKFSISKF